MNMPTLNDWTLSGKEFRKLIYEAGLNSPYSFSQFFGVNYSKVQKWLKLDAIPDGRLVGTALIGLRNQAQLERLQREIEALKQQKPEAA